jgi:AhpD family alkylhydroperoxidase
MKQWRIIKSRIEYQQVAPAAFQAMRAFESYVRSCGSEPPLLELIKIRASQINGCSYCLDMHTKDSRAQAETEQRIYALNARRETPFFTEKERAALAWTEAVTQVAESQVPDEVYELMHRHFSEMDIVKLTAAVVAINGWNRFAISFRSVPGSYKPTESAIAFSHKES